MTIAKRTLLLVAIIATGCASAPVVNQPGGPSAMADEFKGAPVWVVSNCSKYLKKTVVCGVGSIGGTSNAALARSGAEERGRVDIARQLQDKVRAMVKDYQATVTGGAQFGKAASDEQYVADVAKSVTDTSASGIELDESWISQSGTFYALMELNLDKFKDLVSGMKALDEGVRKAIMQRADQAFHDLDAETGHTQPQAQAQ